MIIYLHILCYSDKHFVVCLNYAATERIMNLCNRNIFPFHPLDMRRDVQEIFRNTPHGKQVMMFSATLSKDIRPVCKKFMQDVIEVP